MPNVTITTQNFTHPSAPAFVEQRPELHRSRDLDRFERASRARYEAQWNTSEELRTEASRHALLVSMNEREAPGANHAGPKATAAASERASDAAAADVEAAVRNHNGVRTIRKRTDRLIAQLMNTGAHFEAAELPVLRRSPQMEYAEALASLEKLVGRREEVRHAWHPVEDSLADVAKFFDAQAAQPMFTVGVSRKGAKVHLPVAAVDAAPQGLDSFPAAPNPWPVIARVHRDELMAEAERQLRIKYEGREVLSGAQRFEMLMDLGAGILAAQRRLAAAIWAGEEQGIHLDWPTDIYISPLAVLGIEGPAPILNRDEQEMEGLLD